MTPWWEWMVAGSLLTLAWLWVGFFTVVIFRGDLQEDTAAALFNTMFWPLGVFMQGVWWPIHKRRRERARQARITAKVESGEYAVEHARNLGWKG